MIFEHATALFEALILVFVYDCLDFLLTFSRSSRDLDSSLSFLKDYDFFAYNGSRLFLTFVIGLALTSQEPPFIQNDLVLGLLILLLQVGVIHQITINVADREFSLKKLLRFTGTKRKIINRMLERSRDKERDLWFAMAALTLDELENLLRSALAYRRGTASQVRKVVDYLTSLRDSNDVEQVKAFYSAKIIDIAGMPFVKKYLKSKQKVP